ncbi:MAG: hypothetical protein ACQEVA_06195 [Myxococcota bacterium]
MKKLLCIIGVLFTLTLSTPTAAQDTGESGEGDVFTFGSEPGWQMLGGITAGGAFGSLGGGGFAGLELSISRLQRRVWWGGYLDATYDFAQRGAMATVGPQIGYGLVGLDGGLAGRVDTGESPGRTDFGPQARLVITTGFLGIYGRYVYLLDGRDHLGQAGILLKLPLWAN